MRGAGLADRGGPSSRSSSIVGRGGFCFEQNLLFKTALEALGAEVDLYMARGLVGGDPANPRPRTHLMLGVNWEGRYWHADVGFGGGTLLEPMPWGPGDVHEQSGWRYRVIERHPEYVLQSATGDGWEDLYALIPHPVPRADIDPANWWTSTHPRHDSKAASWSAASGPTAGAWR